MKKLFKTYLVTGSLALSLVFNLSVQAKPEQIDRVAAVVDSGVVLESEVQALLETIRTNAKKIIRACLLTVPCVPKLLIS